MPRQKYSYNEKRGEWLVSVWDGTYNANGTKHRKQISSKKSSADLEKKVIAFKQKVEAAEYVSPSVTFGDYARQWLKETKSAKEVNTQTMYARIIDNHFRSMEHIPIGNITHSHIQQAINDNLDHPRTCQQMELTFRQIIKYAVRGRILPKSALDDVLADISLPKYQKPEKRPLRTYEVDAIFNANLDEKKRCFVSILYYCGLRRGEVLALERNDFKDNEISVSKNLIYDRENRPILKPYPKSDNGIRTVPIPDKALPSIMPFVEQSEGRVFRSKGKDLMTHSSFKSMWSSILTELNKASDEPITGLTPHIFRHNYCTTLCYEVPKISTKMIARLMGDRENMVLDVYSHIVMDKESVVDTLNAAL